MDIEKAKELLEKIRHYLVIGRDEGTGELIAEIDNLLDEPVCETCGGTRKIPNPEGEQVDPVIETSHGDIPASHSYGYIEYIPCPDCQQPPAGEFTKTIRRYIGSFVEACDRLDRLEAEKKELEADYADLKKVQQADYAHAVRNCEIANKLESRLDKRRKIIKRLWNVYHYSFLGEDIIFVKETLGDEDFKECTK